MKLGSLFVIAALFAFAGVASAQSPTRATAELKDVQGRVVGNATLTATDSGAVRVQVQVAGYPGGAGDHGIHIHAVGACTPNFAAAGGHFNPTGAMHGAHAGDLPSIQFYPDGTATYEVVSDRITLAPGPVSIFDKDGSALVIHAGPDDMMTDPSGNSGDRIACGVIVAAAEPAAATTGAAPTTLPVTGRELDLAISLLALGSALVLGGALLRGPALAYRREKLQK